MTNIVENLQIVKQRIYAAEQKYGRSRGSVSLLAVSKAQRAETISQAFAAGQHDFGENYLQEALTKAHLLENQDICWHFIGPIQSNKTRVLAEKFDWIHSLDREKTARRLSEARATVSLPLNVCIQVNISEESAKSGILPLHTRDFAEFVSGLPGICLRGLMVIPALERDFERQKNSFSKARELYEMLKTNGLSLDTLSMGMSGDLEAAIAEGSTMVRIGTAIFGTRHT